MIDEEWLKNLRFQTQGGLITGLVGIGTNSIHFAYEEPDGSKHILQILFERYNLGFHIREIPPSISLKPEYDFDRLNNKLLHLVGTPHLDRMCQKYHELYSTLLGVLHEYR